MELISGALGFSVEITTTRQQTGDYFNSLGAKLEAASNDLEQVVVKVTADVNKSGIQSMILLEYRLMKLRLL
ncbi:hypothetical protein A0V01_06165 (plasmid) [Borrelia hermsii]|uniref:Variable large protein n=1 Tax=Borrelia hermsii TaxID=140 RepID=A0AAN0X7G5_BORHE|nr:hypothetical protein A0V01_06165 [Borrelia hermsii]